MNYKRLYYKYKSKYLGGSNYESPTNLPCNVNCPEVDKPCYEDPIDMECYPKKDMKYLSDNTYYSKNIINKCPVASPLDRRNWTQDDRNKMNNIADYPDTVEPDPVENSDSDSSQLTADDDDDDDSYIVQYNHRQFYDEIGQESGDFIYLVGGGNNIKSLHKYTDLQNDREGRHVFQGEFIGGPLNYQTTDLHQAITYFNEYPSKDDYGVSLSICFIPRETETASVAYCLLAYSSNEWQVSFQDGAAYHDTVLAAAHIIQEEELINMVPLPWGIRLSIPEFQIN